MEIGSYWSFVKHCYTMQNSISGCRMKLEEAKTREEKTCRKYYVSLHYAITYSSKSTKHLFPYCFHWVTFQAIWLSLMWADWYLFGPSPLFLCYNFALFPVFWLYLVVYVKVGEDQEHYFCCSFRPELLFLVSIWEDNCQFLFSLYKYPQENQNHSLLLTSHSIIIVHY